MNMNMKSKIFLISLLLVSFVLTQDEIRFADGEMMRSHHNHPAPNADNLTVHLIPHSHDDVGWLKTVDDYFYGGAQSIQWAGVQYTIDTVVSEMSAHPEYKFSIVEVAFLYRWWRGADETQKEQMRTLIKNGQLEFINGGWCMSDEATPYYEDIIDQMTIGLRWLKQTFNYVPDVAWHIDPFGHQASSASMFSKMGFQAFFFSRIDYQDKQLRMSQKTLEMIWTPQLTVADKTNYIFTHVNYYHYSPPPGFCFDVKCTSEPIKDDESLQDYNILQKSQLLVNYFKSMSLHFRSKNLMHTMGEDFHFANARMWYKNLDKLIKFINNRPEYGVKLLYSTPSTYIKAIQAESNKYPAKTDDFFPYADIQHAYWTGYFVSRVSIKGFVRDFGRWVQAARKQISQIKMRGTSEYIKNNGKQIQNGIWELEMAMGILQHHDGVSGTEKQKVANDYIATALRSINKFGPIFRKITQQQINLEIGENISEQNIYFNIYWNETAKQTKVSQLLQANKNVLIALYNPGEAQKRQIKIAVIEHDLKVTSWKNTPIPGDVICGNINDPTNCELIVTVDFQESAYTYLKIAADPKSPTAKVVKLKELTVLDSAKQFKLTGSASIKITKATQKFDLTLGNNTESFLLNYNYYDSYQGAGQKSGAYIFRPESDTAKKYTTIKKMHYAEGTQVVIIVLQGDKTSSKLTFSKVDGYVNSKGFEIETFIDSIDIGDKKGKEVTLNFGSNYVNNKTFYTDSNGLEEQKRIVNFRPTWPLVVNEAVSGNYYPINSHIGIIDTTSQKRLTIVTDRSQGGTVLKEGQIQIMIHRRTLEDDARGVDEPLNQTQADGSKGLTQLVRHYVVFGPEYRQVQKQNDQKIAVVIAESSTATFAKRNPSPCIFPVPAGVKLYLRPFSDSSYLMRVQNFKLNSVTIPVPAGWQVTEYTLSANQLQSDWSSKQYKWGTESAAAKQQQSSWVSSISSLYSWMNELLFQKQQLRSEQDQGSIQLSFLQIRTFKIIKQ